MLSCRTNWASCKDLLHKRTSVGGTPQAARPQNLAEGKSEEVIAQVGSLVEQNALLKSDNAVLRNEIASLAKRLDKVRAELDAIKRAVAKGPNKEDFEFSSRRSIVDEIVGKGYGHTESGERLLRMHAQEVVELILKKACEDVLKQIELAAAVKDRLTNKDLPVALAIVESVKSWFIAYWSPRDHRRHERRSRAWRAGAVLPWRGCRT